MEYDSQRIDPQVVAQAILTAAGWARVGITMPSEWLRQEAAAALAQSIIEQIEPRQQSDVRQLALFR